VIEQLRAAAMHLLTYPFRVWGFGEGIGIRALMESSVTAGNPLYEGFVRGLFSAWLGRGGPKTFEDHVAPGYELLALWERTGEPDLLDAARRLAALHASFPVHDGIRLHRPDQPGWKRQIWVDCMHVDGPFLARLGRFSYDADLFDLAADRVISYARVLQESGGLFRHGWEADCGVNGELWARGSQIPGEEWLRTGDVARRDDDGNVFIVDRLKDLIKVNAFQVAPAELEALLTTHPAIADAAVIGRADERTGEAPVAFVVARGPLDADDVRAWLAERVAPYKRLAAVHVVDDLPRTPSGKLLRRALVDRDAALTT